MLEVNHPTQGDQYTGSLRVNVGVGVDRAVSVGVCVLYDVGRRLFAEPQGVGVPAG